MFSYLFSSLFSDFGGKDFGKWFWGAGNISGSPKHNLLCSLEHKIQAWKPPLKTDKFSLLKSLCEIGHIIYCFQQTMVGWFAQLLVSTMVCWSLIR